jgi:uncharacterized Fe-S cluster protein YjdI
MSKDKIHTFAGKNIDVLWDKRLCIHVAECGQADNALFDVVADVKARLSAADLPDAVGCCARRPGALSSG